ncbi:MAG TPA: GlsB/YeaQ/YmgE family stress response membrane protein [Blastocatellia bacterium]|nr:GlsB/YeaQ/YmgE family stress response membrane protein [Blastocatellia bacterium]
MTLYEILMTGLFGLIVGVIAKLILPGKDPGGVFVTALIGIAGSFVGTFIGRSLMGFGRYYQAKWLMSIAGAVVLLVIYRMFARRSE